MKASIIYRLVSPALICLGLTACATHDQSLQPYMAYQENVEIHANQLTPLRDDTLRVMTLNMAHARGNGPNQMLQPTRAELANLNSIALLLKREEPDIVSLQEADQQSFWNGNFDHVHFLAKQAGFNQSLSGSHVKSMGLNYGTALVANLDLKNPESIVFRPTEPAGSKGYVVSSIAWPAKECVEVDVVSVHLDFASKIARSEQASEMISNLKQRNRPLILMGDFNSDWNQMGSVVQKLAKELNLHSFQPNDRSLITFPKFNRRLDWILVSPEISFQSYRVARKVVSDHLGLVSELVIDRSCA